MAQDGINAWATFRYALSYPDEEHLARFRAAFDDVPETLADLRVLYMRLFEAGAPHPVCPLLESYYVANRPPGEIVLENKLFYQHFGLRLDSKAAPDHLLTQLEFLGWLEHCREAGNADPESLDRGESDFRARHLTHWLRRATELADNDDGGCYAAILRELGEFVATLKRNDLPAPGRLDRAPDASPPDPLLEQALQRLSEEAEFGLQGHTSRSGRG